MSTGFVPVHDICRGGIDLRERAPGGLRNVVRDQSAKLLQAAQTCAQVFI